MQRYVNDIHAMVGSSANVSSEIEKSWKTLGLRSSQAISVSAKDIVASYDAIKRSGTASQADLARAATAAEDKLGDLTKEMSGQTEAGTKLNDVLTAAGVNTHALGLVAKAAASPITLMAVAVGSVATFLFSATAAAIENAREVRALMAVSGLEAEAADNLADTFKLLGFDTGSLTTALFRMANETDTGSKGLRRLGLSFAEIDSAMNEGELFLLVRDKISAMGTASDRSAALMDVFGRAGRELAPIFALSREEFSRFMEEAGKLSPWSQEMQKRTTELIVAQAKLGMTWEALKIRAAELAVGPLTKMLAAITAAMTPGKNNIEDVLDDVGRMQAAWDELGVTGTTSTKAIADGLMDVAEQLDAEREQISRVSRQSAFERDLQATKTKLLSDATLSKVLGNLKIEEEKRKAAMSAGALTEAEAHAERILSIDVELEARLAAFDAELMAVKDKDDKLRTEALKIQTKITEVTQEGAAKRIAMTAAEQKARLDFDEKIRTVSVQALQKYANETDSLTRRFEAMASVERIVIEQTDMMARAMIEAEHEGVEFGRALSDLAEDASKLEKQVRTQTAALGLTGAEALRAAESFNRFGKAYEDLEPLERETIDRWVEATQTLKLLADASALVAVGYDREAAMLMASVANQAREREKQLQTAIGVYDAINDAAQNQAVLEAQLAKGRAQSEGDYVTFVVAGFAQIAAQSATVWQGMFKLQTEIVQGMQSSISSALFEFFKTGTLDMEKAWGGFMDSMLKSLTDFMAQQAVRQFLGTFFGAAGGGGATGGGSLAGLLGVGAGGLLGGAVDIFSGLFGGGEAAGFAGDIVGAEVFGAEQIFSFADILEFQRGGRVPGLPNQRRLAIVHGQEQVLNLQQQLALIRRIVRSESILDPIGLGAFSGITVPGGPGDGAAAGEGPATGGVSLSALAPFSGFLGTGLPSSMTSLGLKGIAAAFTALGIPAIGAITGPLTMVNAFAQVANAIASANPNSIQSALTAFTAVEGITAQMSQSIGLAFDALTSLSAGATPTGAFFTDTTAMNLVAATFGMVGGAGGGLSPAGLAAIGLTGPVAAPSPFGVSSVSGLAGFTISADPVTGIPTLSVDVSDVTSGFGAGPSGGGGAGPSAGDGPGSDGGGQAPHRGGYIMDTNAGRDVWARMQPGELAIPKPFAQEFPDLIEILAGRREAGVTTINITLNVSGDVNDPERMAEALAAEIDQRISRRRRRQTFLPEGSVSNG